MSFRLKQRQIPAYFSPSKVDDGNSPYSWIEL